MSEWMRWRHRHDHSIEYEVRKSGDGYEFRRSGDERILGKAPREAWETNYEPTPEGDESGQDQSSAG